MNKVAGLHLFFLINDAVSWAILFMFILLLIGFRHGRSVPLS